MNASKLIRLFVSTSRLMRRTVSAALIISIGVIGLTVGSALAAEDSGPRKHAEGQYDASTNTYRVVAGDDLSEIAERLGTTVGELERLNKLASDKITVGQKLVVAAAGTAAYAKTDKPNIVFIMGDDIGMWNIGAYHRGLMYSQTPNIDKLAAEGAIFTDYYAEASCTAGRASFVTGQLPVRTGLATVGQAGAKIGMPAAAPTIATVLRDMGYATGQFGKNHLGDRNEYLPTLHGFDEFFGYLYHLDAMQDPFKGTMTKEEFKTHGPRNVLHTWATDKDDPTVQPRWGKVGKQKIEDKGPLPPHPTKGIELNMETVDDVILEHTLNFIVRLSFPS